MIISFRPPSMCPLPEFLSADYLISHDLCLGRYQQYHDHLWPEFRWEGATIKDLSYGEKMRYEIGVGMVETCWNYINSWGMHINLPAINAINVCSPGYQGLDPLARYVQALGSGISDEADEELEEQREKLTSSYGDGSIPMKIPFLVGWTSINPSYFDVNYRGTIGFDTLPYPKRFLENTSEKTLCHCGPLFLTPCGPEVGSQVAAE